MKGAYQSCIHILFLFLLCKFNLTHLFTVSGFFVDINECVEGSSDCEQGCNNTLGGFACSCSMNYALSTADGKSCFGKILPLNNLFKRNINKVLIFQIKSILILVLK